MLKNQKGYTIIELLVVVSFLVLIPIGGLCWQYAINAWLLFFGKAAVVQFWQGMVLCIIPGLGHMGFVFAGLTWILMLFL